MTLSPPTAAEATFALEGKLELGLGKIDDRLGAVAKRLERPPAQPVSARKVVADTFPAAGVLVLPLDGPEQGVSWYVRSLTIGGLTPSTSAAGRADVFVSATDLRQKTSLAQIGLADWRDQASALPLVAFYGRGELALSAGEQLFLVVSGGTAAQAYVAAVTLESVEQGVLREVFST